MQRRSEAEAQLAASAERTRRILVLAGGRVTAIGSYAATRRSSPELRALIAEASELFRRRGTVWALRRFLEAHRDGGPSYPTARDLYRELQAVTPASLRYLLVDLFAANTFWDLATDRATARQAKTGGWQVTLDVRARKVVADSAGVETEVPMTVERWLTTTRSPMRSAGPASPCRMVSWPAR